MISPVIRVHLNPSSTGRDWLVSDVHGQFSKLERELNEAGFSTKLGDRLFIIGDLVDRGPESASVLEWLDKPWVYALMGNHEDLAIMYAQGILKDDDYLRNGGVWFIESPSEIQLEIAKRFNRLPLAIELETKSGLVGLIHANVPYGDWDAFKRNVSVPGPESLHCSPFAIWDRSRFDNKDNSVVKGIDNVVVGHNMVNKRLTLGNVHHIDTGGSYPTVPFCFLDAASLKVI